MLIFINDSLDKINTKVGTPQELQKFLLYLAKFSLIYDRIDNVYIMCGINKTDKEESPPLHVPYNVLRATELINILINLIEIYEPYQSMENFFHINPRLILGVKKGTENSYFESLGLSARERISMKKWLYDIAKKRNINISLLDIFFKKMDVQRNKIVI